MHQSNPAARWKFAWGPASRAAVRFLVLVGLLGMAAGAARADDVVVGEFSFDTYNPGATDAFTVTNFTGDDNLGFFPVLDNVTFEDINVTYTDSTAGTTPSVGLGDLTPDDVSTQSPQVLASDMYSQAVFQATLSQTIFSLSDGTTFQADSSTVTFTLSPSSPPSLQADTDFGLISVSGSVITPPVPEPPASLLLLGGMVCLLGLKRAKSAGCFENF